MVILWLVSTLIFFVFAIKYIGLYVFISAFLFPLISNLGIFSCFPIFFFFLFPYFKMVSKSIGIRGNILPGASELKKWYNDNLPLPSRELFYSGIERLSDGKILISHWNSGTEFSKTWVYQLVLSLTSWMTWGKLPHSFRFFRFPILKQLKW